MSNRKPPRPPDPAPKKGGEHGRQQKPRTTDHTARPTPDPRPPAPEYEAEIIPGLGAIAEAELAARVGSGRTTLPATRPDVLRFRYHGDVRPLLGLRAVVAVSRVESFAVPRPRGLLGNAEMGRVLGVIEEVRRLHPAGAFRSLHISAAGADSPVLVRLRETLAARTGLTADPEEGDLLLRLRRAAQGEGWEVVIRLSPRPLTARAWRVCNWPGALNAVVAHAMATLGQPAADDRVLNLVCGSGTLLIERLALAPARLAVGCDWNPAALACAAQNLTAAHARRVRLVRAEAGQLPFAAGTFSHLLADLPFGQLIGSHAENAALYPRLLDEATRVAAPGAQMVLITHEVRLLERLLAAPPLAAAWHPRQILRITLPFGAGGINPRIYWLQRT